MFAQVLVELEEISLQLNPVALDGRQAVAVFDDAARAERLCAAIKSRLARRVEETRVWRESGHRSAAHWVAEATGETVGAASRTLETARALDALPAIDEAFRAGLLSEVQAAEVAGAAAVEPHAEAELLEAAGSTSVKGLRDRCRQVRAGAEADDQAWARRLHVERRANEWTDPDGAHRLRLGSRQTRSEVQLGVEGAHRPGLCEARRAGRREPRRAACRRRAGPGGPACKPVEVRVTVDSAGCTGTRSRASAARSPASARCQLRRRGRSWTTPRSL